MRSRTFLHGVDMSYWSGHHGGCWWNYFHGKSSDEDWADIHAFARRAFTTARPGESLLTLVYASSPLNSLSSTRRREIADLIKETRDERRIIHHAFATDSAAIFMMNMLVSKLSNKPWVERTFVDPGAAFAWLSRMNPRFAPTAVARAITAAVPKDARWSAIPPPHPERRSSLR